MLGAVAGGAQTLPGYSDVAEVKTRMAATTMRTVEGIWRFPANGTSIAVERDDAEASRYRVVVLESPYLVMEEGQLLGYAVATARRNVFEARLRDLKADGSASVNPLAKEANFMLTIDDDALVFKPLRKGFKLSWDWWRMFPYMFRVRVDKVDDKPAGLEGAVRVWPRSTTVPPREPRYL